MPELQTQLAWEPKARKKYETMIAKIPLFHREIAKTVVNRKAVIFAQDRKSTMVEESDIIRAFLSEVPMSFYSLMIRLFQEVKFDYKKYESQ